MEVYLTFILFFFLQTRKEQKLLELKSALDATILNAGNEVKGIKEFIATCM